MHKSVKFDCPSQCDRHFSNLSGIHHQSRVSYVSSADGVKSLVVDLIGQRSPDVIDGELLLSSSEFGTVRF